MTNNRLDSDEIVERVDAEVKRVSKVFRFILQYKEQFQPSGIEFSELRNYLPSDDASHIDWKSSARLNDLYVKEYEEEQDMDVFIIMDVSDTMQFGTADKTKLEYSGVLASTIAYASVDAGINVGIGFFGDDDRVLVPKGGTRQYRKILTEVVDYDSFQGSFNLEDSLDETMKRIKDDTFIFVISDFIDFSQDEEWKSKMNIMSEKFRHVLCLMVRDLRDYKLPDTGNVRFRSPSGDDRILVNTREVMDRFQEEAEEQEEKVAQDIRGSGAGFLKIDTRDSFAANMMGYFDEGGGNW